MRPPVIVLSDDERTFRKTHQSQSQPEWGSRETALAWIAAEIDKKLLTCLTCLLNDGAGRQRRELGLREDDVDDILGNADLYNRLAVHDLKWIMTERLGQGDRALAYLVSRTDVGEDRVFNPVF